MITAERPITTLGELRDHLQYAIGLELTTIPPYLCALYTIDQGANTAASEVIQSVVLEEMLHMSLAANVLNAIGGVPSTGPVGDGPSPVPVYPAKLPFIDRVPLIHLQAFSPEAIDDFIAIERPDELPDRLAAATRGDARYDTIGAFYAAIEAGLLALGTPEVFEQGRKERAGCQLTTESYYGGAGTLIEVTDRESAIKALTEIVREGEGVPESVLGQTARAHMLNGARTPGRLGQRYSVDDMDWLPFGWKMYSHFARFREIRAGRYYRPDQLVSEEPAGDILPTDWHAVRPMAKDPAADIYRGTPAYRPMMRCNQNYTALVDMVYRGFNGEPSLMQQAVVTMYDLKYQCLSLLNTPSPLHPDRVLGPPFEYLSQPGAPDPASLVYPQSRRLVADQPPEPLKERG